MSMSTAVGTHALNFTVGGAGAAGTGAFSIVALVQGGVGNNNAGFVGLYASATYTRGIGESSLNLYGPNDFSSGVGPLVQGNWYVVAVTKSSASTPWRMHYWAYNSTPSGAFTHAVATTSPANQGNGSTITQIRLGANGTAQSNGLIALAGVWNVELSDAQIDTLVSASASAWSALSPVELISLENWAGGGAGAATLVGTSAYSATTGTVSVGANPSGFSFSISGGPVAATAALTAVSTLSASGIVTQFGGAALTAAATLTASATRTQFASATLAAVSALSATATVAQPATASLAAVAALSATATRTQFASAPLAAVSTLTASATRIQPATATLAAVSVLSAAAGAVQPGTAALAAVATLTAAATRIQPATAPLAAVSVLSAAATRVQPAAAPLTAGATLTASPIAQRFVSATLTASAVLAAAATGGVTVPYHAAVLTPSVVGGASLVPGAGGAVLAPAALTSATFTPGASAATLAPAALVAATLIPGNL